MRKSEDEQRWREHTRAPMAAGIPTVRAMAVYDLFPSILPNSSRVAPWCSLGLPSGNSTSTSWCNRTISYAWINDNTFSSLDESWVFITRLQAKYYVSYLLCARIGQSFFHAEAGNVEGTLARVRDFFRLVKTQKSDWIYVQKFVWVKSMS